MNTTRTFLRRALSSPFGHDAEIMVIDDVANCETPPDLFGLYIENILERSNLSETFGAASCVSG